MKVFIVAAVTADGFIGKDADHLADWTSKEDKQFFTEVTKRAGVMVMGRSTYETIGRPLPGRKSIVYTRRPLANAEVVTTQLEPAKLLRQLEKEGYDEVAICGGQAIYDMFLQAGLVDELYLTIEPLLFGQGLSLAGNKLKASLSLKEATTLNDDTLLVKYEVNK